MNVPLFSGTFHFKDVSSEYIFATSCITTNNQQLASTRSIRTSNFVPRTFFLIFAQTKTIMPYRIGSGVDFHKLVEGRDLWIGGVKVPHHKGALGHSDADVLLHAICDAMLGAVSLGDIGVHFPDTDVSYKNIDSKILLKKTKELIIKEGYAVVNIDTTLCLQAPKIKPYVAEMQKVIADIVGVTIKDVSVKATTTEQLGFIGREEGLVAYATVMLRKTI